MDEKESEVFFESVEPIRARPKLQESRQTVTICLVVSAPMLQCLSVLSLGVIKLGSGSVSKDPMQERCVGSPAE